MQYLSGADGSTGMGQTVGPSGYSEPGSIKSPVQTLGDLSRGGRRNDTMFARTSPEVLLHNWPTGGDGIMETGRLKGSPLISLHGSTPH